METVCSLRDAFEDHLAHFGAKVNDLKDSLGKAETVPWHEVIDHISEALDDFKAAAEQLEPATTSFKALSDACKSVEPSQFEEAKSILDCSHEDMSARNTRYLEQQRRLDTRCEEVESLVSKISAFCEKLEAMSTVKGDTFQADDQTITNTESD
jgi:hypothetical protein